MGRGQAAEHSVPAPLTRPLPTNPAASRGWRRGWERAGTIAESPRPTPDRTLSRLREADDGSHTRWTGRRGSGYEAFGAMEASDTKAAMADGSRVMAAGP